MKILILILVTLMLATGCVVTGTANYKDPKTGATMSLTATENIDAKTIKALHK